MSPLNHSFPVVSVLFLIFHALCFCMWKSRIYSPTVSLGITTCLGVIGQEVISGEQMDKSKMWEIGKFHYFAISVTFLKKQTLLN